MGFLGKLSNGHRDTEGAAAVEFALVLPLLMLLVLGGLDWGYYFFIKQVSTNAAREGARAGSLELDATVSASMARSTVGNYLSGAGLDPNDPGLVVNVNVTDEGTAANPMSTVRVDVSYPAGSLTGFTEVIIPDMANATAQMRRF